MDSLQENYDKAMELLEHARREADAAMERSNQTAALQQRIAELEKALVELYGILIPEAQPFPGGDSELASYAAKTLPFHVKGLLRILRRPHESHCECSSPSIANPVCTCWKSALDAVSDEATQKRETDGTDTH